MLLKGEKTMVKLTSTQHCAHQDLCSLDLSSGNSDSKQTQASPQPTGEVFLGNILEVSRALHLAQEYVSVKAVQAERELGAYGISSRAEMCARSREALLSRNQETGGTRWNLLPAAWSRRKAGRCLFFASLISLSTSHRWR